MDLPLANKTALRHQIYNGWMESPNSRSTMSIIWTCLTTIVLCVYTAVHMNIPGPAESMTRQRLRRAKWVMIAILAPELALQVAWKQFIWARQVQRELKQHIRKHRETAAPATIAAPGHATVESEDNLNDQLESGIRNPTTTAVNVEELKNIPEEEDITLTYAFYAVMGGFRIQFHNGQFAGQCLTLTAGLVSKLAKHGCYWKISEASIQDRSKADGLAKILVVLQVLWMLIQCIARAVADLPITLLEIHTFAHAVCAAIMFLLWFKKPVDVHEAMIRESTPEMENRIQKIIDKRPEGEEEAMYLVSRSVNHGQGRINSSSSGPEWNNIWQAIMDTEDTGLDVGDELSVWNFLGIAGVQVFYGCFHMTAWKVHFPSTVESWCWRAACIVITSAFICTIIVGLIAGWTLDWGLLEEKKGNPVYLQWAMFYITVAATAVLLFAMVLARVYVVVESFISLRSVPIGTYAAIPWANYIPHI